MTYIYVAEIKIVLKVLFKLLFELCFLKTSKHMELFTPHMSLSILLDCMLFNSVQNFL